jgi:hypothetical protein
MRLLGLLLICCSMQAQIFNGTLRGKVGVASGGGVAFVNAACGQSSAGTSTVSANFASTTGNALFAFAVYSPGGGGCSQTVSSVQNAASQSFTSIGGQNNSAYVCSQAFYLKNITGNASDAVTITWSGSVADGGVVVMQASGVSTSAPLDAGPASAAAQAGSPANSATYSTGTADEILFVGAGDYYVGDTLAAATGYTLPAASACNTKSTVQIAGEYKVVSSTQTNITSGFTVTGTGYTNIDVGTFK